jgi:hypothetical protein
MLGMLKAKEKKTRKKKYEEMERIFNAVKAL